MEAATIQHGDRDELVRGLSGIAKELRITDLKMISAAGSGHPGGTLSAAEMIAALYFHVLRVRPDEPDWPDRDRFVLSKGHCVPIVYAALAKRGFFDESQVMTLRKFGSPLQGHPDRVRCPGIEASTGSLGQGLSIAVGMALASRLDGGRWRSFCMMGDGESQAGQIWEAAMLAGKERLANLIGILDYNQVQQSDLVKNILDLEPVVAKWRSFNWHVREIDGHDMEQVLDALDEADMVNDRPALIVSHTIKGRGVSWMELNPDWHGKAPNEEQLAEALKELEAHEAGRGGGWQGGGES